jgi:integrase
MASTREQDSRVKLTKTSVDQLAPTPPHQRLVRDSELRGFALRITPAGVKAFILEKRIQGRVRRVTIGRYGELTVAQARNRAQQLLGEIALGEDPVANRKRARATSVTLDEAYRDFLEARQLRRTTRADYDRAIHVGLEDWKRRPLHTITGNMVIQRHQALAKTRGEQGANNYMRVLRAIYAFAIDRYDDGTGRPIISHNPVLILSRTRAWFRVDRRRTLVKPHELPGWTKAVESLRDATHVRAMGDTVADFLLLLLFTGLRRREASTLRWRDVDFAGHALTVSQTKSHRPHTLPFGPFVHSLLTRRLGAQQNEFVFPGWRGIGHLIEPKRQIKQVVDGSGVPFSAHDLRRTFLTIADALNLSPYTIKRLANHSTRGDVTAGYIMSDVERLREPMEKIERYLVSAMGIDGARVVTLRAAD